MRSATVLVLLLLGTHPALAQVGRITVAIGETVQLEVGFAVGVLCDDPEIVRAEMRNKTEDTNELVLTGLQLGTTLCRAGTVTHARPSYLFEITVVAAPPAQPGPPPRRSNE